MFIDQIIVTRSQTVKFPRALDQSRIPQVEAVQELNKCSPAGTGAAGQEVQQRPGGRKEVPETLGAMSMKVRTWSSRSVLGTVTGTNQHGALLQGQRPPVPQK